MTTMWQRDCYDGQSRQGAHIPGVTLHFGFPLFVSCIPGHYFFLLRDLPGHLDVIQLSSSVQYLPIAAVTNHHQISRWKEHKFITDSPEGQSSARVSRG